MNAQTDSTMPYNDASSVGGYIPVDRFDTGMDLLVTAQLALKATDWHDPNTLTRISSVLDIAADVMRPLREVLNVGGGAV